AFLATDASEKAFSRHWGEEDIIEDHEWYLPHVKKELPIYSGDIEGYRLSYWLPESQFVNLELQSSGPFSGLGGSSSVNHYLDHLNNPQRCIRNNKHDGKTPSDFFIEGAEWGAQDADASETDIADWRCLDWIGEVNPYMAHHRRPHQTDGFFQRLISGLQAFHAYADSKDSGTSTSASSSSSSGGSSTGSVTEGEGRYTYRPDVDRLHLLPPNLAAPIPTQLTEKIRADLQHVTYPYQCNLLDELIQENYKYDTANIVDPGTAAETSVEMFTRFKGCWGFQGQATEMFPIHKMEKLSRFNYRENRTE
ncbi:MAG: hypothetical protein KDD53_12190, partial [Bdellovibrionales bacterium]|nr:hypothetical protein [Bdellovibrionales bacterium]